MTEQELAYAVKVNDRDLRDLVKRIDAVNLALGPQTKKAVDEASAAIALHARTRVKEATQQRQLIRAQLDEYKQLARQAKRGSDEQIAASMQAARAARKLGLEVHDVGIQYDYLGRKVSQASRGLLAGTGIARGYVRALAVGSSTFLGFATLGGAVRMSWEELKQGVAVARQTQVTLKSTGDVAGTTAAEIDKLALAEMRKTGMDDEAIKSAENWILTFRQVRNEAGAGNDIFTQSIVVTEDLARAMANARGGEPDLAQASNLVGKALNDPIKGLTSLQKVGVTFTASQRAQIKAFMEAGNIMAAQKVILAELRAETEGSAHAYGQTLPGQIDVLQESVRNLGGSLLRDLQPEIKSVVRDTLQWIDGIANNSEKQRELKNDVKQAAHAVRDAASVIKEFVTAANDAAKAVGGWKHVLELLVALKLLKWAAGLKTAIDVLIGGEGLSGLLGAKTAAGGLLAKLNLIKGLGVVTATVVINRLIKDVTGKDLLGDAINDETANAPGYPSRRGGKWRGPDGKPLPASGQKYWNQLVQSGMAPASVSEGLGVTVAAGANRKGAPLHQAVVDFVAEVARVAKEQLTITTGTNHDQYVKGTKRQSGHWAGDAADIFTGGGYAAKNLNPHLTKLGQDALIAAGAKPAWARKQTGGLYNINGRQIIFNSMEGGDHYNHLHVGVSPGAGRFTPHNPGDFKTPTKVDLTKLPGRLRYALALAEGSKPKADDRAAINSILTFLRGQLGKTGNLGKKADILDEINSFTNQLEGLTGKKKKFASGASVLSFKTVLAADLKDLATIAAAGFDDVAAKARPKIAKLQKLLAGPITSKELALAKVHLQQIEKTYDLKGLVGSAADVAAAKKQAGELVAVLAKLPAQLKIPVEDAWGEVVDTLNPSQLREKVNEALRSLGGAKDSASAKDALEQLKKLGDLATKAVSIDKDGVAKAAQDAIDAAQQVVSDATSRFESAWGRMANKALSAFDQETQDALQALQVLVGGPGGFLYSEGALTPAQAAAKQLRDQTDGAAAARDWAAAQQELADKQARVGKLAGAGVSENSNALRQARADLADAQKRHDELSLERQLSALDAQGELEQTAAQRALEQKRKDFQAERDLQRDHFQDMLDELEKGLTKGTTTVEKAKTQLGRLWDAIGLDAGDAGRTMGEAFVTSLNESLTDPAVGIWPTLDNVAKAIADLKQLKDIGATVKGGRGPAAPGDTRMPSAGRPVALAGGAWVTRRPGGVAAVIGEGAHDEVVAPEPKLRRLLREELARTAGGGAQLHIGEYHAHDGTDAELLLGKLSLLMLQRPRA